MKPNHKLQDRTQMVVASRHLLHNDPQDGAQLVELTGDTQEGTELVAAFQEKLNDKSQKGTQLIVAYQPELRDDTKGAAELAAASQKEHPQVGAGGVVIVSKKERTENPRKEAELLVASQMELNDDPQEGGHLVVASQQELNSDPQDGAQLVVTSQGDVIGDTQEETELVAASQKELNDKSQEKTQLVVASQQELGEGTQGRAEPVAASRKDRKNDPHEGADVVVAGQKEGIGNTQEEHQQVAASQMELNDDAQEAAPLVVASQQELQSGPQNGCDLVVPSQEKLRDEIQEGTDRDVTLHKDVNIDAEEGTELVLASRQNIPSGTLAETEMVEQAHGQESNDNPDEKSKQEITSQKELNTDVQQGAKLVAPCEKDLNDDYQEANEVVVAAQKDVTDHAQEEAELVAASQEEPIDATLEGTKLLAASHKEHNDDLQEGKLVASPKEVINDPQGTTELFATLQKKDINDSQAGTELMAASQKEVIDEPQEGTEPEVVSHEVEEGEEFASTDGLATATSMTTEVIVSNSLLGTAIKVPVKPSVQDENPPQVPASGGRKRKLKDIARCKPHSVASPATEDSHAIEFAVARKSEPRRRLTESIRTHRAANIAIDPIQQISDLHSSPNVHGNLHSQFTSLDHGSSPSISLPAIPAHRQELPYTRVSPVRIGELLQTTNSASWRPVTDCDTPFEPLATVHCIFPPSATESPPVCSGRPPRPPSSTDSRGFNGGHPSDFTNLQTVQENGHQGTGYREQHPHEASLNHGHPHGLYLPHASRQPLPSASQQFSGPLSLSTPELDPSDATELPTTLGKRKKSNWGDSPQQKRRNVQKRRLEQQRTQVFKKLKTWGRNSKLIQEADVAGQYSNDQNRLIMGEEQREVFVKNMVEICRKDPQMRETFLAAVKQLANIGVLHSSSLLLKDQDPSGRSQDVLKAWKEIHLEFAENSSAAVNLYRAVDELHKQGEATMRKLPPVGDLSLCSLSKTSDGPWELVFPDFGPLKRAKTRNEERLDEPLRPSKRRT